MRILISSNVITAALKAQIVVAQKVLALRTMVEELLLEMHAHMIEQVVLMDMNVVYVKVKVVFRVQIRS